AGEVAQVRRAADNPEERGNVRERADECTGMFAPIQGKYVFEAISLAPCRHFVTYLPLTSGLAMMRSSSHDFLKSLSARSRPAVQTLGVDPKSLLKASTNAPDCL